MMQEMVLRLFLWRGARGEIPLDAPADDVDRELASKLSRALTAPLDALGIDATELAPWQRTQYVQTMTVAFQALVAQAASEFLMQP